MKIIHKSLVIFLFSLFTLLYFGSIANDSSAAIISNPTCAAGDGCKWSCDIETDPTCIPACTPLDSDCTPSTCRVEGSGGLIPCGKNCEDPLTPDWDERESCTLCTGVLMGQLIIEFMVKLAGVAAVLAIAAGGFLYMFAVGNAGTIDKAKSMIKYVLIGFLIVFIAWALIDTILTMFGYIDPVGGDWYAIDC